MVEIECLTCHKPFRIERWLTTRKYPRRFCTRACATVSRFGRKHTPATRAKISASHMGRPKSLEARANMSIGQRKRIQVPLSAEHRARIAASKLGKLRPDLVGPLNPSWKGGVTPLRQAFYHSQEWKDACSAVWKRDKASCQRCHLRQHDVDAVHHVHHIVSFKVKKLRAEISNLALLCNPCHNWVHSKSNTQRLWLS